MKTHLTWLLTVLFSTLLSAQEKPNVIIIFCDDMGYADIGPFGGKGYETPNLDRMADEGMRFTDFHVGVSVCSPSRSALMTGCYPLRVGVPGNFSPRSATGLNPAEVTIAEIVKQSGYATAMYGKWHLGHKPEFLPTSQGFDEWFGLPYSNDMWPYHPDPRYNFPDLPLMENETILNPAILPKDQVYLTTWYTERTVSFIEKNKDHPFFIYLPHAMPHVPLYASDKYAGKTPTVYGDIISEIDWSVGQILDALKRTGIDEKTLVVFTSDNGPWLLYGNHGGSAGPLREGKGTQFEGGFRVPCIMRWPETIPAGRDCDALTATMDLLPTVAALAGVELPANRIIDGKDIRPLIFGEEPKSTLRETLYYYGGKNLRAVRKGPWKLVYPHTYSVPGPPGLDGIHGQYGRHTIEKSLFHLETDVGETRNLLAHYPEVARELEVLGEKARQDLGDGEREGANRRPTGKLGN
jgi:arylsulfatase A-like enzyme